MIISNYLLFFQKAQGLYEQNSKRSASSYEQYAIQYLQTAKTNKNPSDLVNKQEKLFFFYSQKSINNEQKSIEQCEKLARQCDELKMQLLSVPEPEPPRTSSPAKEQQSDINISNILSPVVIQKEEQVLNSTLFATPPSNKSRDDDVQTFIQSPPLPSVEEIIESPLPPYVDLIFSHMNEVNQWINKFCADNESIQNDINIIRVRFFFFVF